MINNSVIRPATQVMAQPNPVDAAVPAPLATVVEEPINSEETKRAEVEKRLNQVRTGGLYGPGTVLMQTINLYPTHVEAILGGIRKTISISDFKQILDGFIKSDKEIENMQMPFGTFLFGKANGVIHISCYYPSRRAIIKHLDRDDRTPSEFSVPLPNIVISHQLKQEGSSWIVQDTRYFCTDRKVTSMAEGEFIFSPNVEKGIYLLPFTNMYPEGRMCFGGNSPPRKCTNNLNPLDYYYKLIEASPFNNDLGLRGVSTDKTPKSWFKEMSEMTEFNYTKLRGYRRHAGSPPVPVEAQATTATNAVATATFTAATHGTGIPAVRGRTIVAPDGTVTILESPITVTTNATITTNTINDQHLIQAIGT